MKKKKLCVFTKYSNNGPSSNFRVFIFLKDLEARFDIEQFSFWGEKYYSKYSKNKKKYIIQISFQYVLNCIKRFYQVLFIARGKDVVFFQKTVIPFCKWNPCKFLRKHGSRVVLDIDDAVYLDKLDNTSDVAEDCNAVIVGNDTLKKYYESFNNNVYLIPTVDYSPAYQYYRHDTFLDKNIIWIGSAASIDNLNLVVDALNKLIDKHPEVHFLYICNKDFGYTNRIKNSIFIPWSSNSYLAELSKGTVGIMPLEDTAFNRGKCGFKIIQYLNMEKPSIVSNVGVNGKIIQHYGLVASSEEEWIKAIEELLFDKQMYDKCVQNIRNDFMVKYGYSNALNMLESILGGKDEE